MPRRRALLASLGAAAVAGCVGSTPPRTSTGTPRSPDTPDPLSSIDSDWPVPGFDAGNSNRTGAAGPVERIAELWSITADARLSHAVLADETLYVGSRAGTVLAVDARTGEARWQRSVGDSASTPRVVSGLVCVPTNAGIVALEPTDGSERWRVETPNRANGSLLAASHGLYWVAGEGHRNEENPTVVSVDSADGSERWRTEIGDPWSRRLFASGTAVFVSTSHHAPVPWRLAAETGEIEDGPSGSGADFEDEWFYRDGTLYSAGPMFGPVEATPVDDGRDWKADRFGDDLSGGVDAVYGFLSDGDERALHALRAADGSQRWTAAAGVDPVSRPVVAESCVLLRTADALRCFDPVDGSERWSFPVEQIGRRFVVADDLLFTTSESSLHAFR